MAHNILFIQGGGGDEDYQADAKLVSSLRENLGSDYHIHYPRMIDESLPDFGRIKQIHKEIALLEDGLILVGHSLGGSMLLKYLSENTVTKKITGIFLLATPYWRGDEDWKEELKLHENFSDRLPKETPVFLYHCHNDGVVAFEHLSLYTKALVKAIVREVKSGDHQFNNNLSIVARDIKSLQMKD